MAIGDGGRLASICMDPDILCIAPLSVLENVLISHMENNQLTSCVLRHSNLPDELFSKAACILSSIMQEDRVRSCLYTARHKHATIIEHLK
jgi:hypothetical protein